ncbi:40S ribosomal protein S5-1 [Hordeum vulgare]|nr:40S ribosomal protein S5-1 [Hordeum vulgare]
MREGMLHIRDVEGPKKTGSMETRLQAMEQQVFKCQGMVERGLNANHMMITEFTSNHKMDAIDIGKHLSRLYDRVDQLQGQIYDLQNQNYRLATIERKIDALYLREREKPMVDKEHILKIDDDWEPFVRISISNQDFLAYYDIGSMVSTMPKVVYDSLWER